MKPNPVHRLPAPLEAAVQRLKMAAREACERSIESLGLAALASTNAFHRDGLLGAQFELNRKSAVFVLTFNDAFDDGVLIELGGKSARSAPAEAPVTPLAALAAAPRQSGFGSSGPSGTSNWDALSLVDDREVEAQISAQRFGLEIAHACEWELRELEGYVSALLDDAGGERDCNPLRPALVGQAMIRGIEAISERAEIRKVLSAELSRSLNGLLPATYADVVADLRGSGVQPRGMAVRARPNRADAEQPGSAAEDSAGRSRSAGIDAASSGAGRHYGFAPSTRSAPITGSRRSSSIGQVDPALMSLIRRLAFTDGSGGDAAFADFHSSGDSDAPLPNLIRAHRDELRQASSGALDHMVIDVIGFLFDQILADPNVPPQMARQIARLQLPVLRTALGDPSFFSSRRHPVRRFINRIASLGAAFEDFDEAGAQELLAQVKALVQQIVEGDFDQIETYEQKLVALERYTADAARRELQAGGDVAALLSEKEDQQRLRQLYALRLAGDLKGLAAPAFLSEFLSAIWSQVLLRAAEIDGADGARTQRLRAVGRELFLSVQAKATPTHRKAFLAELPRLMQELTEGMNLIGWPEAERRAFFNQLMPAHADALKSAAVRTLDINLMARQVEGALQRPLPSRAELRNVALPVLTEAVDTPRFTAEEADRAGLLQESAVDWSGTVELDIDLNDLGPAATGNDPATASSAGLPTLSALAALADSSQAPDHGESPQPAQGAALADHLQVGFAYRMNLDGEWQKVRLTHVSEARSFFIFTHGGRHKKTVSLTRRMLDRLCAAGRLRAFETAFLIERATARTRRQLAGVASPLPSSAAAA